MPLLKKSKSRLEEINFELRKIQVYYQSGVISLQETALSLYILFDEFEAYQQSRHDLTELKTYIQKAKKIILLKRAMEQNLIEAKRLERENKALLKLLGFYD